MDDHLLLSVLLLLLSLCGCAGQATREPPELQEVLQDRSKVFGVPTPVRVKSAVKELDRPHF
jgi:hypothetical protein